MATGYTHSIKNDITFEQFALLCARAFGACIEMRDDPTDKPIPKKFKVDSYHAKELKEAKTKLKTLTNFLLINVRSSLKKSLKGKSIALMR